MARPDEVNAIHVMKLGQSTALMLCKLKTNHRVYERAADGTELGPFNTLEGHFISSSGGPVSDHSNGLAVFRQGEPSAGYFPGISTSAVSISAIWTFFWHSSWYSKISLGQSRILGVFFLLQALCLSPLPRREPW